MLRIRPSLERVQDEHQDLLDLVEALRRRLAGPAWQDGRVGSLLASLIDHLETHFNEEETGGFFDQLLELAPNSAPRIDALLLEHHRLLGLADELSRDYHNATRTPASWRRLGDAFERFRQNLMVHECEERHLLQETHSRDIGSKD